MEYLPQNTTVLIQPLNQDVVATFKASYLQRVFCLLVRIGGTHAQWAVLDFWWDYSFLDAVYKIFESWEEVPLTMLNCGWKKLWPE